MTSENNNTAVRYMCFYIVGSVRTVISGPHGTFSQKYHMIERAVPHPDLIIHPYQKHTDHSTLGDFSAQTLLYQPPQPPLLWTEMCSEHITLIKNNKIHNKDNKK